MLEHMQRFSPPPLYLVENRLCFEFSLKIAGVLQLWKGGRGAEIKIVKCSND